MTAASWPAWGLCIASGASLGLLFLLLKLIRILLQGGRLCAALMDLVFGVVCGAAVFLCALAVDKGRLRFFQASMQGLGAWGVVVAFDPLLNGLACLLRRLRAKLRRLIGRPLKKMILKTKNILPEFPKKPPKRKKLAQSKKNRKKALKNLWKLVYNGKVKIRHVNKKEAAAFEQRKT